MKRMLKAAITLKEEKIPPPASPRVGARARSSRPTSMITMEIRKVRRMPHLSARPPKSSMQMVMPAVSSITMRAVLGSSSPPYWLK